ncbi:MAG: potassium channel protein [Deltaproteobacteria bacterium]|nr:potassium channel protein [Deltaproteobacteria bacterium]
MPRRPTTSPFALHQTFVDLLRAASHIAVPVVALVVLTVGGALGYHLLLDLGPLDALYQSVTTLSTVGFSELVPFTDDAKIFTIALVILGVGTVFYTLTLVVATVIEGELRTRFRSRIMQRKIESLDRHYVLCGYGRVGVEVARGLAERGEAFVVVDQDPGAVQRSREQGYLTVEGSITEEEILREAGTHRAKSLIATANSDAVNTYVALTAKHLQPEIFVVARSEIPGSDQKLRLAGADQVISPHALSGRRMMLSAVQPLMTDFMDTLSAGRFGELVLAEFNVTAGSPLNGSALSQAFTHAPSVRVLGIRRTDGEIIVGPKGSHVLGEGDMVILLADEDQIARLHAID